MERMLAVCLGLSLSACAPQAQQRSLAPLPSAFDLPAPLPHPRTLEEALAHLPFVINLRGADGLGGTGTVTREQIIEAAARAGIVLAPERIWLKNSVSVPTQAAESFGFRALLSAPATGQSGEVYHYKVQLFNTTGQQRNFIYGAGSLNLVISKNGKPVFWTERMVTTLVGFNLSCAPHQFCQGGFEGEVMLNRFNPRLKLPPDQYDLTVFLNSFNEIGSSRAATGSFLVAQQKLTVMP